MGCFRRHILWDVPKLQGWLRFWNIGVKCHAEKHSQHLWWVIIRFCFVGQQDPNIQIVSCHPPIWFSSWVERFVFLENFVYFSRKLCIFILFLFLFLFIYFYFLVSFSLCVFWCVHECFVCFSRELCLLVLLESFVYVFCCVCKFCCNHRTETEMVWLFWLSLLLTASSHPPPPTAVAAFMAWAQNWSLSSGHWSRVSRNSDVFLM